MCSSIGRAMQPANEQLGSALARLQGRWGTAAIRLGNGDLADAGAVACGRPLTVGALALAPELADPEPLGALPRPRLAPLPDAEGGPLRVPLPEPLAPA